MKNKFICVIICLYTQKTQHGGKGNITVDAVRFIIGNNNTYYKLEPGKDLLGFAEFNFSFFWEQCIEAGKAGYKTGRLPPDLMQSARSAAAQCHPYVKACISSSFDSVAVDCIIAYICSSEHIGLEELWARCISPKNNYESAIFRRISEYKTGRSVNQWINIVRMQEYAAKKLDFIYNDKPDSGITPDEYRRRKEYFDLAFSITANEMGFPVEDMPYVRKYSPSLAPEAAFRMGKFSHYVYGAFSEELKKVSAEGTKHIDSVAADRFAMDAFAYIKNIPRPDSLELRRASMDDFPEHTPVYMPTGFKGIIDLEFDLLDENNKYIERCASCGRYFIRDDDLDEPYCSRVNPSGRTCRSAYEEQLKFRREAEEKARIAEEEARRAAEEAEEKARLAEQQAKKIPVIIPKELELRSQALCYNLSKCAGREMDKAEFEEWSGYLERLKDNIRNGDGSISQLEDFIGSAEKMYGNIINSARVPEEKKPTEYAPKSRKTSADKAVKWVPRSFDSISEAQKAFEEDPQAAEISYPKPRPEEEKAVSYSGQTYSDYAPRSRKVSADKAVKWVPGSFDSPPAPAVAKAPEAPVKSFAPAVPPERTAPKQSTEAAEEHISEDGRKYKPFVPKKYASLYEAMTDPKVTIDKNAPTLGDFMGIAELAAAKKDTFTYSEETDGDVTEPSEKEKTAKTRDILPARVIRKPDWTTVGKR